MVNSIQTHSGTGRTRAVRLSGEQEYDPYVEGLREIWNLPTYEGVPDLERRSFILKSRMPQSEYKMNIFYIIGVVVVILFVAGFFGLHV